MRIRECGIHVPIPLMIPRCRFSCHSLLATPLRLGSCRLPAHVASLDIELAEIEIEMREPEEKVELEEMMMGETQDEVDLGVMYNGLVSGYEPRDL